MTRRKMPTDKKGKKAKPCRQVSNLFSELGFKQTNCLVHYIILMYDKKLSNRMNVFRDTPGNITNIKCITNIFASTLALQKLAVAI